MNTAAVNATMVARAVRTSVGTRCATRAEREAMAWEAVAAACDACQAAVNRIERVAARRAA